MDFPPSNNGRARPSVAVVGGGFGGVGAAVMLRRAGYRGRDRVRARRAHRRRVEPQHLSRRRVRHPVAPLRVLVRPEPAVVAPLCAAGGDPGLPRGRRAAPRRHGPDPHGHQCAVGPLGRRARQVDAGDERRPARGRCPADRVRPALGPRRPADRGPRQLRRTRHSTRRNGATTSSLRASGWPWSVPVAARSRSCRRSSPIVAQVDVYQRSPGWTLPKMDFEYKERTKRLFERFPVLARLDRQAIFWFQELAAAGMTRHVDAAAVPRHRKAADHEGDRGSGAPRQGHAGRRDRLQADHAHRRLVSDPHQAERRPRDRSDRRGHADRHPDRGRPRAPGGRARARNGLQDARLRRADGDRRRGGPHARPGVGGDPTGVPGDERASASPTCSSSTGRTRTGARGRSST